MKSFLSWVGGKSHLVDTIVPLIPAHHCYVEVFAGAAWTLFAKPESSVEVINDINGDLITLYRVVQCHLEEFVRYFKWALVSRDEWDRLGRVDPSTLTDIQRAARFYYRLRMAYGGKVVGQSFGASPSRPPRLNLLRIEEDLSAAHLRLSRAYIENQSYIDAVHRYDRPDTFFYLDPPYYQFEDYYGKGLFGREDFERLRDALAKVEGKWMVSINDVDPIRMLFKDYHLKEVETVYSLAGPDEKPVRELLITNYEPIERGKAMQDDLFSDYFDD